MLIYNGKGEKKIVPNTKSEIAKLLFYFIAAYGANTTSI